MDEDDGLVVAIWLLHSCRYSLISHSLWSISLRSCQNIGNVYSFLCTWVGLRKHPFEMGGRVEIGFKLKNIYFDAMINY